MHGKVKRRVRRLTCGGASLLLTSSFGPARAARRGGRPRVAWRLRAAEGAPADEPKAALLLLLLLLMLLLLMLLMLLLLPPWPCFIGIGGGGGGGGTRAHVYLGLRAKNAEGAEARESEGTRRR